MNNDYNEDLPDFKQLNDRVIAPTPKGPFFGIRTNLDSRPEETGQETTQSNDLPSKS
jgi:hypothetical protein